MMHGALAAPALELLLGPRPPYVVDQRGRVARDLLDGALEMLRPQPQARRARHCLVPHDDVHLGVVEEGVLVEVRRPDREPAVVDDADLRMHVYRASAAPALIERAGEEARGVVPALVVGVDEDADLAAGVVAPVVRARGEDDDDAEVVMRWTAQILREDGDELARPEELALEVDEPLGGAHGSQVALEDRELTRGHAGIDPLGHGADEL